MDNASDSMGEGTFPQFQAVDFIQNLEGPYMLHIRPCSNC